MDAELSKSPPRLRSSLSRFSTPPRIGGLLQLWLFAIPLSFVAVCVVGWLDGSFHRIGNNFQSAALSPSAPSRDRAPMPTDSWNPLEVLAPYAPYLWLALAACLGAVLIAGLAVAVARFLPERRSGRAWGGLGNFGEPKDVFVKRQHLLRILENDVNALFEGRIQVRHVMTRSPVTVSPGESLAAACELMDAKNVNHLAVCNDDGLLVGMLSRHYARRSGARTVEKAMLAQPVSVAPDSLLNPTVTQMIRTGVSCVAVVAEGYCVGILTTADVQLTLQCALTLLFKATSDDPGEPAADESELQLDEVLASVGPGETCAGSTP